MEKVFIVSAARTAIGKFGGTLKDVVPGELGTIAAKAAIERSASDVSAHVDEVIIGNVLGAGYGMNIARQICLGASLPVTTPSYTINKVCGSGLKSVTLAAQAIASGENQMILAGGVENMSAANFIALGARWGNKLGHAGLIDLILQDGLTDIFNNCHMGITAENLAEKYEISREAQDKFALASQQKAHAAMTAGHFKDEITSVPLMKRGQQIGEFNTDEYVRSDASLDSLSALKPAFKKEGTVTAGNASGINDGSAMLLLASEKKVAELGLKPLAEVVGWASAGVAPEVMGIGPVEAVKKVCTKTGISLDQIEMIESNEAFAAQALAVDKLLEWDTSKVNLSGGAIALGHPIGASGARILVTLLYGLKREGKSLGLATLCVGGGQGVAIVVRAV